MDREEKLAQLMASLERAAEQIGDITRPVCELYYSRHPEAQDQFEYHDRQNPARLEGSMVEQVLYCLMQWFESPGEIEIVLITTVPHHIETLGVSETLFTGLLTAVCDTILPTIPPEASDERAVWEELQADLLGICREAASHACPHLVRRAA